MKQLSLLDDAIRLSGVMVAIKTAMRDAAGAPEGEGRKMLADRLNEIAQRAGIKLTGGNTLSISKATLDKWLAPSDTSHPPSILALLAFCRARGWPVRFFSAEALERLEGEFTGSPFVKRTVGVDNVCERSAALASGGALIGKKYVFGGVTLAMAQKPYEMDWTW